MITNKLIGGLKTTLKSTVVLVSVTTASFQFAPNLYAAYAQATAVFSRVDVAGNERIASDTIRSIAGIPSGARVTPGQVNSAIQNLYNSGLFETVDIRPEGGRLMIEVQEHPTINLIRIEGNKRLKDDSLLELVQSKSRRAFSPALAEVDAQTIAEAYAASGRLAARVSPKIIRRSDNRVDLVFEVKEGRITEIGRVTIIGNRKYSDGRLRRALATKQAGFFRTFVKADTYIAERIEVDKARLRQFYENRGYIDFDVRSTTAELAKQRNTFQVTYNVHEGQQYSFGETTIVSLEGDIDAEEYQKLNKIRAGSVYRRNEIDTVLERIDHKASSEGKNFIQSVPRITRNDDTRTIDVEFEIVRGPRLFVERIDIEGNSTTLDRVIRSKFDTVEGDTFNRRDIKKSSDRIRKTGFFKNVDVQAREGTGPEQVVLDVDVEEKPTGTLGFGVSASSDSGLGFAINVSERNFLGRGQKLAAAISTTSDESSFNFEFVEPALLGRDIEFGINIGYGTSERSSDPYDTAILRFAPHIAFPVSENGRLKLYTSFSRNEILVNENTGVGNNDLNEASLVMQNDFGKTTTGLVGIGYAYNKLDSIIDPTAGYRFNINQEFAGLTGDRTYSKTTANAKFYKSFFNEELIVSAEIRGGVIATSDPSTLITERFMLGGAGLRGFEQSGIGPRDQVTDQVLGGNKFVAARIEASFPLGIPEEYGIHGGLFFDAGSVWGLDRKVGASASATPGVPNIIDDSMNLRTAVGFSLFWETPLGPLRFDFSKPIKKQDYDDTETFRFSIATRF